MDFNVDLLDSPSTYPYYLQRNHAKSFPKVPSVMKALLAAFACPHSRIRRDPSLSLLDTLQTKTCAAVVRKSNDITSKIINQFAKTCRDFAPMMIAGGPLACVCQTSCSIPFQLQCQCQAFTLWIGLVQVAFGCRMRTRLGWVIAITNYFYSVFGKLQNFCTAVRVLVFSFSLFTEELASVASTRFFVLEELVDV